MSAFEKKPSWNDLRPLMIFLLLILVPVSTLAWHDMPVTHAAQQQVTLTPSLSEAAPQPAAAGSVEPRPRATLLPLEYLDNSQQTTGIIFVAAVMVMIVVAGVLYTLVTEKQQP